MNKKLFKSLLLVFVLTLFVFTLASCGGNNGGEDNPVVDPPAEDWDSKVIANVELESTSFEAVYDVDDFKVSLLKLHIYYDDGTERDIECNKDMFDEDDYKKFSSAGTKKVTLYYNEYEFDTKVNIVDYAVYDEGLNRNFQYGCVIKVIRNQRTNKLDFIMEPNLKFAGCQMKYTMNTSKLTLSNFELANKDNTYGMFTYDAATGTLIVDFVSSENLDKETTLFSCDFSGDFRISELKIDETFENKVYTITDAGSTEKMMSVLYHVSKK